MSLRKKAESIVLPKPIESTFIPQNNADTLTEMLRRQSEQTAKLTALGAAHSINQFKNLGGVTANIFRRQNSDLLDSLNFARNIRNPLFDSLRTPRFDFLNEANKTSNILKNMGIGFKTDSLVNKVLNSEKSNRNFSTLISESSDEEEDAIRESSTRILELESQLLEAKRNLIQTEKERDAQKAAANKVEAENQEYSKKLKEYEKIQKIGSLMHKIHPKAVNIALVNDEFKERLLNSESTDLAIMSIDIRRSTELMLKAKSAEAYAGFISEAALGLRQIIIENFGICDKFTGDGILAYFPIFFSGPDHLMLCLRVADQCHAFFAEFLRKSRSKFQINYKEMGLGIGIDAGKANLVTINDEVTIIGTPVVYACRFSNCPAGHTVCNQGAKDILQEKYGSNIVVEEAIVKVKNEPEAIGYHIAFSSPTDPPTTPEWLNQHGG